ncbi:MAG: selenide, water dikinase [Lysobacteraceae bacterium]|nr:MAG: selenide, water dikinase [Xanthomonadaceae bacterium]
MDSSSVRLTQYSHGAGCGCKIGPDELTTILSSEQARAIDPRLLVGNQSRDDAAVVDLGDGSAVVTTTDFFMPIVDDPRDFGRVAATNAISDIYAMGGTPLVAIAILGWPVNTLAASIAAQVVEGGRDICEQAGISLAGGHSIDCPEPVFGLAVTGRVMIEHLKRNDQAQPGDVLCLSKPLGIGILSTAGKKGLISDAHARLLTDTMCQLNKVGAALAKLSGVHAMTDVTGFGLAGHLSEMCLGSDVSAQIDIDSLPTLDGVKQYHAAGCVPGGTMRNYESVSHHFDQPPEPWQRDLICDPQTSGGLLVAVAPAALDDALGCDPGLTVIGRFCDEASKPKVHLSKL